MGAATAVFLVQDLALFTSYGSCCSSSSKANKWCSIMSTSGGGEGYGSRSSSCSASLDHEHLLWKQLLIVLPQQRGREGRIKGT